MPAPILDSIVLRAVIDFSRAYKLSARETHVVECGVAGLNESETAERLECKGDTVRSYWRRVLTKTKCSGRIECLALFARISIAAIYAAPVSAEAVGSSESGSRHSAVRWTGTG